MGPARSASGRWTRASKLEGRRNQRFVTAASLEFESEFDGSPEADNNASSTPRDTEDEAASQASSAAKRKNGTKAGDIADLECKLVAFALGSAGELGDSLEFSQGLTSAQRKNLHQIAERMGLLSANSGEGASRRFTVYRPSAMNSTPVGQSTEDLANWEAMQAAWWGNCWWDCPWKGAREAREEKLSRLLSSLLRHSGPEEGLEVGEDGYAKLQAVVALPSLRSGGFTATEIESLVARKDDKKRFNMSSRDGERWIRANQGHTIRKVKDSKLLELIERPEDVPCCVHGTYFSLWPEILSSGGLSRMNRNHIHFAPSPPGGTDRVISGLRSDAEVAVFVSVESAMADNIEFFRSANDVLLTRGDENGKVPLKHIERALRMFDGMQIWPVDPAWDGEVGTDFWMHQCMDSPENFYEWSPGSVFYMDASMDASLPAKCADENGVDSEETTNMDSCNSPATEATNMDSCNSPETETDIPKDCSTSMCSSSDSPACQNGFGQFAPMCISAESPACQSGFGQFSASMCNSSDSPACQNGFGRFSAPLMMQDSRDARDGFDFETGAYMNDPASGIEKEIAATARAIG